MLFRTACDFSAMLSNHHSTSSLLGDQAEVTEARSRCRNGAQPLPCCFVPKTCCTDREEWASMLSCCHAVMLSCCHVVMLSCCHVVMLSCCHVVKLSCCHAVMLSCCHVVMLSCCHVVMLSCCHAVMLSCCHVVMLSCCHVVMLRQPVLSVSLLWTFHPLTLPQTTQNLDVKMRKHWYEPNDMSMTLVFMDEGTFSSFSCGLRDGQNIWNHQPSFVDV